MSTKTALLPIVGTVTAPTADPVLERDTEALYDALSELVRVYQFRDRDRICCYDVSVTQCYALEALVRRGGMTLNDLAAQLYLDKSTASRVVDALERKGYVTRLPHPEDRRAVLLEATEAGRALEGKIRDSILAEERRSPRRLRSRSPPGHDPAPAPVRPRHRDECRRRGRKLLHGPMSLFLNQ